MSKPAKHNQSGADWLPAIEAVHWLSSRLGGDKVAKAAIYERLRDDAVRTRVWWLATAVDVGKPYLEPSIVLREGSSDHWPPSKEELTATLKAKSKPKLSISRAGAGLAFQVLASDRGECILGGAFWRGVSKADQKRWDWATGFFLATDLPGTWTFDGVPKSFQQKFPKRTFALGAEFFQPDIERISATIENPKITDGATKGRKLSDRFPEWVGEVALLVHDEEIALYTANMLVDQVAERLSKRGIDPPSKSTVYKSAVAVLTALQRRF